MLGRGIWFTESIRALLEPGIAYGGDFRPYRARLSVATLPPPANLLQLPRNRQSSICARNYAHWTLDAG